MGSYFSQEVEVISVDGSEEQEGTPQPSPISKLFTFVNDPRSPAGNLSRTPILVQNQIEIDDPRSPGSELVERTPLYVHNSNSIPSRFFCDHIDEVEENDDLSEDACPTTPVGGHSNYTELHDPRSPLDSSRTPMGATNEDDEVTETAPIYSPFVRFKMDNEAYQHSPVVILQNDEQINRNQCGRNMAFEASPAVRNKEVELDEDESEYCTKIEDIDEDYDNEIIGGTNNGVCSDDKRAEVPEVGEKKSKPKPKKDGQLRKRFNATQKSFMKTVLFKPYNELNEEEISNTKDGEPAKRMPLGMKNTNGNISNDGKLDDKKKKLSTERSDSIAFDKLPFQELSLCDKENRLALK